jgi:hypothetical protein
VTTNSGIPGGPTGRAPGRTGLSRQRRVSTETKASFKTTELIVYVIAVAGVLIASALVGTNSHSGVNHAATADYFRADRAWVMITALTIGYMISRGLAKSGSRDYYDDHEDRDDH